MIVSLIVAAGQNGAIGKDNALLWHLPDDFKRFKKLTMGKPIIMGRKTYESIGKALPGRVNIIITHNQDFTAEGCQVVTSIEEAFAFAATTTPDEVFIIGGGAIYKETIARADRIYLTEVQTSPPADTYFHIPSLEEWKEINRELHPSDEKHEYAFSFIDYQRIN